MHFLANVVSLAFGLSYASSEPIEIDAAKKWRGEDDPSPPVDASVLRLNRYTFRGNVLQDNAYVRQWVVLYCLPWFPPCQAMQETYNEISRREQKARNADVLVSRVRFAQVDCATDKVLCNDMRVGRMPYVAVYEKQTKVANWFWRGDHQQQDSQEDKLRFWFDNHVFAKETLVAQGETGPGLLKYLLLKCFELLGNSWLGRMWCGIDHDVRMVIGMVCFSTMIWGLMRFLLHCGMQDSGKSCDDPVPELTQVPLSMVRLDAGGQGNFSTTHKQGNKIDLGMFPGELRKRNCGESLNQREHLPQQEKCGSACVETSQFKGSLIL